MSPSSEWVGSQSGAGITLVHCHFVQKHLFKHLVMEELSREKFYVVTLVWLESPTALRFLEKINSKPWNVSLIEFYLQCATKWTRVNLKLQPIAVVYSFLHHCWQKSGTWLSFLLVVEPHSSWAAAGALPPSSPLSFFLYLFFFNFLCLLFELLKGFSSK